MLQRSGLAIGLFLLAAVSAAPASQGSGPRVDILVDGHPRPRYLASGTSYVEAIRGREYEIRLYNPYPVRVAVALSIDGLNSIDAAHTTAAAARKWVLDPYETVTISGWQTSQTHARRFQFTTEEKSYGQWLGRTNDLGVISAVFFRERVARLVPVPLTVPVPAGRPESAPAKESGAGSAGDGMPGAARSAPAPATQPEEYAATGIGRRTDHAVHEVFLDLEETPAASISIRYEYRQQLVRLGILPAPDDRDGTLARRERARGFLPGFCPEPKW
jgi:hypothetical protein